MGHTACCTPFTTTYLVLLLRQSDVSREPVTIRSDDIFYAVKLKMLHVLARKPKVYPRRNIVLKSFHGDVSLLACLISCQSVEFRSVLNFLP